MLNCLVRKSLVVGIIVLFVGAGVVPGISGKINDLNVDERILNVSSPSTNSSSLTFHTFDKTEEKQCNAVLSTDNADDLYDMFEELKYMIVYEPKSNETQALKIEFVEMLDAYGLIPDDLSKSDVIALLNPSWLDARRPGGP